MIRIIQDFLRLEAASGMVLMLAAAAAMLAANSSLAPQYNALLSGPLTHGINDGLMVLFFLLVGLEIKHEMREGELSTRATALLPVCAALGGVAAPALIYAYFNHGTDALRGWAIPSATDIAFSLGVLALFGSRVHPGLKIFLMALAVMDDLAAIVIIALCYTERLHGLPLAAAAACAALLLSYNLRGGIRGWVYVVMGIALWACVLASGVHATVAGVVLAFLVPAALGAQMVQALHPWVAFGVVPLFAFFNAGIPLSGISSAQLAHPVTLGIALGLFAGKQLGIFATAYMLVKLKLAELPQGASWTEFYAVCLLAGIGFTMSLFIGLLAFDTPGQSFTIRLGVITGSLLSALAGCIVMQIALGTKNARRTDI